MIDPSNQSDYIEYTMERTCIKCNQKKSINDFYKQSRLHSYQTVCKKCWNDRRRKKRVEGAMDFTKNLLYFKK